MLFVPCRWYLLEDRPSSTPVLVYVQRNTNLIHNQLQWDAWPPGTIDVECNKDHSYPAMHSIRHKAAQDNSKNSLATVFKEKIQNEKNRRSCRKSRPVAPLQSLCDIFAPLSCSVVATVRRGTDTTTRHVNWDALEFPRLVCAPQTLSQSAAEQHPTAHD